MRDREDPSTFYTFEIFASPAAHALHMKTPTMKAWGAFQYGDRKPIVKKRVTKLVNVDVGEKTTAPPASSIAAVGMIEVERAASVKIKWKIKCFSKRKLNVRAFPKRKLNVQS